MLTALVWIGGVHHAHVRTGNLVHQGLVVIIDVFGLSRFLFPIIYGLYVLLYILSFKKRFFGLNCAPLPLSNLSSVV